MVLMYTTQSCLIKALFHDTATNKTHLPFVASLILTICRPPIFLSLESCLSFSDVYEEFLAMNSGMSLPLKLALVLQVPARTPNHWPRNVPICVRSQF